MRFNEKDLAILAKRKGQIEGRLQYRAPPGTFRDSGEKLELYHLSILHFNHGLIVSM